jgi:phosphatidylinositol glycan class M
MNQISVIIFVGFLIRIFVLYVGNNLDTFSDHWQYTDIDYKIFSDGGKLHSLSISPFERPTFRYPPILSFIMIGNSVFKSFGKFLFIVFDTATIFEIYTLQRRKTLFWEWLWCFNPLSIYICTRGSMESMSNWLILVSIRFLLERKVAFSGIVFGFLIYFRIYPIVYAFGFAIKILFKDSTLKSINISQFMLYGCSAFSVLLFCVIVSFNEFREPYITQAIYYHLIRLDHRHNFSPYFYLIYLEKSSLRETSLSALSMMPFIVQGVLLLSISTYTILWKNDIMLCLFLCTISFVSLNKVITGQYFLWVVLFIPFLTMWDVNSWKWKRLVAVSIIISMCILISWLYIAYNLEFETHHNFFSTWIVSIGLLVAATSILHLLIAAA